jgi:hypothetical protein
VSSRRDADLADRSRSAERALRPEAVVQSGGGATETHERGHLEDSLELDETTRDGDLDMVLHFRTKATGLSAGGTEACVKGEWTGPGGETFLFFGCDAVRIIG